jgi:hypothetical protein
MTLMLQLIGPFLACLLYVMVFQKAGFRGLIYVVCASPLIGVGVTQWAIRQAQAGAPHVLDYLSAVLVPLSLLPLIILAFLRWPPVPSRPSEK